jgi:histidinol dehydrogenase
MTITPTSGILRLVSNSQNFTQQLDNLLAWESVSDQKVEQAVTDIIAAVKKDGDSAVIKFTQQFDAMPCEAIGDLVISAAGLSAAFDRIDAEAREALNIAAERIRRFHERQKSSSWQYEEDGVLLGQKVTPLDRVGIYVPGGQASYPSSVLMNAIPAKVAGVGEIIMVTPTPNGLANDMVLAAAHIAGITQVFCIGGAQAVAALAYGTQGIPSVDKIVGPGNIYVATAKKQVFGRVGIDMIAGPSEILVICDGDTDPDWIAMDLFSQAEHDADAQAILISPDSAFLDAVQSSIARLIEKMDRKHIIGESLSKRGAFILVADLDEAIEIANRIAPEHLELSIANPEQFLPRIRHAGAIFMGRHTAEALGDYCAGPNHVLPTSGTARFFSPLGVYDFEKRSSIINASPEAAKTLGHIAATLADSEGLQAHAQSARYRT